MPTIITLDPTPSEVEIIMDSVPPRLDLDRDDDRVSIAAYDWVSEGDDIRLEYRVDQVGDRASRPVHFDGGELLSQSDG